MYINFKSIDVVRHSWDTDSDITNDIGFGLTWFGSEEDQQFPDDASFYRLVTKAYREKLQRERLNDRFLDLSTVLDPGRAAQKDKPTILDDALELKELNAKLLEEIKCVKVTILITFVPASRFVHAHLTAYQAAPNKMAVFPSYGLIPMWQYLPPATCDTSRDHELRPPAA
ncbi:hypothetical protein K2173_025473 [Erythroxylum novogranatense]|uniref:Uncharacterized protein n=1 Tax=Erythroxylum novogranatense TaxID=1862640 RepID=A0AAV8SBK6_9ROSI|nr:hypothetical protein K2173_025473 [Erythroxylum novogranatense]